MSDIVDILRAVDHGSVEDCFLQSPLFEKAAAEIERLRGALRKIANLAGPLDCSAAHWCSQKARAALEDKG